MNVLFSEQSATTINYSQRPSTSPERRDTMAEPHHSLSVLPLSTTPYIHPLYQVSGQYQSPRFGSMNRAWRPRSLQIKSIKIADDPVS